MKDEKLLEDELLSDEELDNVAGGSYNETAGDTRFFRDLGVISTAFDNNTLLNSGSRLFQSGVDVAEDVAVSAWGRFGVSCNANAHGENKYYIGSERVSRQQAMVHVCKQLGASFENVNVADYFSGC